MRKPITSASTATVVLGAMLTVVALVVLVRLNVEAREWRACGAPSGDAWHYALFNGKPGALECIGLAWDAGNVTTTTEPYAPASVPPPSLGPREYTGPDYGKVPCSEGGCAVYGPCPLGYPTVSDYNCTTPTIPPDQWPASP